jgi:hypothetical protein
MSRDGKPTGGRPKGSRNKTTKLLERWLLDVVQDIPDQQWEHPLATLLHIKDSPDTPTQLKVVAADKILRFMSDVMKVNPDMANQITNNYLVMSREDILSQIAQLAPQYLIEVQNERDRTGTAEITPSSGIQK